MSKAKKTPLEPHPDRLAAFKDLPDTEKWSAVEKALGALSKAATATARDIARAPARERYCFADFDSRAARGAWELGLDGWLTFDPEKSPRRKLELSPWGRFLLRMLAVDEHNKAIEYAKATRHEAFDEAVAKADAKLKAQLFYAGEADVYDWHPPKPKVNKPTIFYLHKAVEAHRKAVENAATLTPAKACDAAIANADAQLKMQFAAWGVEDAFDWSHN